MSIVSDLVEFLSAQNPRFRNDSKYYPEIEIEHQLGRPANKAQIKRAGEEIPDRFTTLREFYRTYNGAKFFVNKKDPEEAVYLLPLEYAESEKDNVREWLTMATDPSDFGEELDEDGKIRVYGLPNWWDSARAVVTFGYSPESFIVAIDGPHVGKVFWLSHDEGCLDEVFDSVDSLFQMISREPVKFVQTYFYSGSYDTVLEYCSGAA